MVTTLVCYALADNDGRHGLPDKLVQVDMRTAKATLVGATGTHHAEYGYDQARQAWQPVGLLRRASLTAAAADVAWSLQPTPGMHYLQVWAVDANGKATRPALQAFINYLPDPATIAVSEHQIYRYTLVAGETMSLRLTSLTSDVDLAVWGHTTSRRWRSVLRPPPSTRRRSRPQAAAPARLR